MRFENFQKMGDSTIVVQRRNYKYNADHWSNSGFLCRNGAPELNEASRRRHSCRKAAGLLQDVD